MVAKKKERSSNIELLRILSMLMIIAYHIFITIIIKQATNSSSIELLHNGYFIEPKFYKRFILLYCMEPIGLIGNNIFILISGYFTVKKKDKINMLSISKKLFFQCLYAVLVLIFVSLLCFKIFTGYSIKMIGINFINSMCWFVGYYYLIILIAYLFLNKYLNKISSKKYLTLLAILFCLTQFSWSLTTIDNLCSGLNKLLIGVFMYCMGGYINKTDCFKNVKSISFILILLASIFVLFISHHNDTYNSIINNSSGVFYPEFFWYNNFSFICVIDSICIFELFRRIKMKNSKIINYIASSVFMIYLLHENDFVHSIWDTQDWITPLATNPIMFILKLLLWVGLTFLIPFVFYCIYDLIKKNIYRFKHIFFYN